MKESMFKRPVSMDELIKASDDIAKAEDEYFKEENAIELELKRLHFDYYYANPSEIQEKEISEGTKHKFFEEHDKEYAEINLRQLNNKILRSDITSLARRYDLMRDSFARDTRAMNR